MVHTMACSSFIVHCLERQLIERRGSIADRLCVKRAPPPRLLPLHAALCDLSSI